MKKYCISIVLLLLMSLMFVSQAYALNCPTYKEVSKAAGNSTFPFQGLTYRLHGFDGVNAHGKFNLAIIKVKVDPKNPNPFVPIIACAYNQKSGNQAAAYVQKPSHTANPDSGSWSQSKVEGTLQCSTSTEGCVFVIK